MIRKIIRVARSDSAFVYAILESLEGMASYSTVGDLDRGYRQIELHVSKGFAPEVDAALEGLRKRIPILECGDAC